MKIGKVSGNILKRSVLGKIKTKKSEVLKGAGVGEDCAFFALSDSDREMLVSCMQEGLLTWKSNSMPQEGEESKGVEQEPTVTISQLLLKCANNLAAGGAEPLAVMLTLLLPKEAEEPWLKSVMTEAEEACHRLSIEIAGGQTRVTGQVKSPLAIVTGYGKACRDKQFSLKSCKPNQDIVISKWIGLEGTAILAHENKEKLLERYPAYLVEEAEAFDRYYSILPEAATAMKSDVCAMHDASEGGIFAALWELAEGAGVGLTIDLKKLPLRQETVEVCECLGKNPYQLLSGGSLLMVCDDGVGLCEALHAQGIPAVIVGRTTDSNDRMLLNEEEARYLDRPKQDEIYENKG